MSTIAKKRGLLANVRIGSRGALSVAEIRQAAQSDPKGFMDKINGAIARGEMRLPDVRDLKGMFYALGDVQVPVVMPIMSGVERSIMASAFPLLVGGLVVAGFNEAYESVPTIGQDLVTEIEDNKKVSVFANVRAMDKNVDRVDEGNDFPEISAGEDTVQIGSKRNGRKLSITAEMVEENNLADIVNRVNTLGEISSDWIEEQTLDRVTDRYGSATSPAAPYVYKPNGTGTQLYNHSANNPGTRAPLGTRVRNNELVDETDLEAARAVLAAMKNERGKRINIPMSRCTLLVPDAKVGVAQKILNSEMVPGVENEVSNWGPRGSYRPALKSSPKLDDIGTAHWYLGDFKRQFRRKWKLMMEYVTLSGDTQTFLDRRVVFQARIAWDCEVGALDYVNVVQSLNATTAP